MHIQIMIQQMVNAIEHEQELAYTTRNSSSSRSYLSDESGFTSVARYVIGSALERTVRSLRGAFAPSGSRSDADISRRLFQCNCTDVLGGN